jgi:hypothetical protein
MLPLRFLWLSNRRVLQAQRLAVWRNLAIRWLRLVVSFNFFFLGGGSRSFELCVLLFREAWPPPRRSPGPSEPLPLPTGLSSLSIGSNDVHLPDFVSAEASSSDARRGRRRNSGTVSADGPSAKGCHLYHSILSIYS